LKFRNQGRSFIPDLAQADPKYLLSSAIGDSSGT